MKQAMLIPKDEYHFTPEELELLTIGQYILKRYYNFTATHISRSQKNRTTRLIHKLENYNRRAQHGNKKRQ